MDNVALMEATRGFFKTIPWTDPVAVTLTLKKSVMTKGCLVIGADDDYRRNVRHFLNALNKKVYRGLARKGWLINVAAVKEIGDFGRAHYHLVIDKPPHVSFDYYVGLIHKIWTRTTWGHKKIDVGAEASDRWINYITKLRSKPNYADAIDWNNTHVAGVPLKDLTLPFKLRMLKHDEIGYLARKQTAYINT